LARQIDKITAYFLDICVMQSECEASGKCRSPWKTRSFFYKYSNL